MSIGVHSETVVTNKVYTFGSSSTPTGWTLSRTSGHLKGINTLKKWFLILAPT